MPLPPPSNADFVSCKICPRSCRLREGDRGFCYVRQNQNGRIVSTTYGRGLGFCVDPIEKKPLFHFYPGTSALSFGTPGCNLSCVFCQNWSMSRAKDVESACENASPDAIVRAALAHRCRSVAFTYNDPIVWTEYAADTARACRVSGVKTVAVTSGYITPAARSVLFENMDAANVDLKGFSESFYMRYCKGALHPVLDTLRWLAKETNVWLEITNLIIPEANDEPDDIRKMCDWIVRELGADVPLHFSAFHPDYKLTDRGPTPVSTLLKAASLAKQAGLRYVYTGNVVDPENQNTHCPHCEKTIIRREGYALSEYALRGDCCGFCGEKIAGRFDDAPGDWGSQRQPIRIADYEASSDPPASESATNLEVRRQTMSASFNEDASPVESENRPRLTSEQELRLFQAVGRYVEAVVRRRSTKPFTETVPDIAEMPLYGTFVSLKRHGQLRSCCGYIDEQAVLSIAVSHAAERAAKDDPRFPPITPEELNSLDMEVWILWGPEEIAAKGEARVREVEIGKHGLICQRGSYRGLLLPGVATEHHFDSREFLRQTCRKAGLPLDAWLEDTTQVMRFEGYAIHGPFPPSFEDARPSAVAGMFYPGDAAAVRRELDQLLAGPSNPQPCAAALIPHAGWKYSGHVAASVFNRIEIPQSVIILCPKHRAGGATWAAAPFRRWLIPGGEIAGDVELTGKLVHAVDGLELDPKPHEQEHAIEVMLPFLARIAPQTKIVGVTVGGCSLSDAQHFAYGLSEVMRSEKDRPLIIVSSDMNHFATDAENRIQDRVALDAIETLNPTHVYETVHLHRISMCGVYPCVIAMEALRLLGALNKCELVNYATSGDVTGEKDRVVGYAGMIFN